MSSTEEQAPRPIAGDLLLFPQSYDTKEINTALAIVQGEIGKAIKKSQGTIQTNNGESYSFKYADLAAIIDLSKDLLSKNGISVTARPLPATGGVRVQTVLRHVSGQWLSDGAPYLPIGGKKVDDPKAYGAAISYLRRYGLAAMLNIAQADNENELATPTKEKAATKKPAAVKLAPIDKRDELLARIQALPEDLKAQIASKLKTGNVVWTQLTPAQLKNAEEWTATCEGIAEAAS